MLSIANEVDPLIFHCERFVCDTNYVFFPIETIYIASSRGRIIDFTTRDMGSELRYDFRKVLGTQNYPTLRLAFSHYVLYLNPIKNTFNIASILTHTLAYI